MIKKKARRGVRAGLSVAEGPVVGGRALEKRSLSPDVVSLGEIVNALDVQHGCPFLILVSA